MSFAATEHYEELLGCTFTELARKTPTEVKEIIRDMATSHGNLSRGHVVIAAALAEAEGFPDLAAVIREVH
jgi:hypothetical protein